MLVHLPDQGRGCGCQPGAEQLGDHGSLAEVGDPGRGTSSPQNQSGAASPHSWAGVPHRLPRTSSPQETKTSTENQNQHRKPTPAEDADEQMRARCTAAHPITVIASYAAAGPDPTLPVRALIEANVTPRCVLPHGVPQHALR
ncbi:MAG: hypothetical protein ACRDR6_05060 [Pseudonocardiaceae bacterium]